MKNRLITNAMGLLQIAVISAMTIGAIGIIAQRPSISTAANAAQAAPAIGGNYGGNVALKFTLGGVYSDTLATPTPPPTGALAPKDVGQIDLTLFLSQNGNAVSGYVNLDASLVFSPEHTIQATPVGIIPIGNQPTPAPVALKIGPTVQGTFDGTTLNVLSEKRKWTPS